MDINHGAGRLRISSGAAAGDLLEGDFHGGLEVRTDRKGDLLHAKLSVPVRFFPFGPWDWGRYGLDWSLVINREIPYSLGIHTGAIESTLDLGDLLVNELRLQTGASSTSIVLPMNAGHTQAVLEAGAASIRIKVPSGVAARIFNRSGLSSVNIEYNSFSTPRRQVRIS